MQTTSHFIGIELKTLKMQELIEEWEKVDGMDYI
jgi:hypothetical protein